MSVITKSCLKTEKKVSLSTANSIRKLLSLRILPKSVKAQKESTGLKCSFRIDYQCITRMNVNSFKDASM